jgi:hypothetical protein
MQMWRQHIMNKAMASKHASNYLQFMHTSTASRASKVPLAYELHSPLHTSRNQPDLTSQGPIVFLHGFLGSKRENKGVSKYVSIHRQNQSSGQCIRAD